MNLLETHRLSLRHLSEEDAEFILELLNEPAFLQNIGDKAVRNAADASRYIQTGPLASYQQFGFGLYLVASKETGAPMGICGLLRRESMEDIEIGFAFLQRFWANGYAYESAAAVMEYGRTALGLKRITATTAPGNRGCIRLLEKLGMHFDRMIQMPGYEGETSLYIFE